MEFYVGLVMLVVAAGLLGLLYVGGLAMCRIAGSVGLS